ncbi:MAG: mandelate racemase [Methylocapsa sp.]|nr:mandelate racemase [Methylocapsa sp.]
MRASEAAVERVTTRAFRIPTDAPESDGTLEWDATILVLAEVSGGGQTGLGYTYASAAAREVITEALAGAIAGRDAFDVPRLWAEMAGKVRNLGWRGVCACAISAVDVALWDLKAKLLELPAVRLLGAQRGEVTIYGSGGFTSYTDKRLKDQLACWAGRDGCKAVKMKVGRDLARDPERVAVARSAIGGAELYVDANGALNRKQALAFAQNCYDLGVTWFEEPVSSDDLDGLRLMRDCAPPGIEIAAGEYGYEPYYFRRMLEARAVDVLQADATRCGGFTGFLKAAALAEAFAVPFSAHTAPALHLHAAAAAPQLKNLEWFYDHVRIENMLFDGAPRPVKGAICPDLSTPGLGLAFKEKDAEKFAI